MEKQQPPILCEFLNAEVVLETLRKPHTYHTYRFSSSPVLTFPLPQESYKPLPMPPNRKSEASLSYSGEKR